MARRPDPAPPAAPPPPEVTVVVLNYNGRDLTPACLASLPPGVETIVVDNGSKDGSPDEIAAKFPAVTLVRNPVNRGFAAAVNQGLALARGRYCCLLNNDARLTPEALSALVAYLDGHPDAGIAAPQLLHEDGRRQHSFDNFPSLATVFLNKSLLRLLFPARFPSKKQEYAEPRDVESVIGACLLARRELVDRIGPLDEAYFFFVEETDWCLRARQAGLRVVFVPAARVVHLQGRTADRARVRARIEYTRSLFTFFRKNRPRSYPVLRALHPVKNLVEFVFQTLTLFAQGVPRRWIESASLLGWQLAGCPRKWGLSGGAEPRYVSLSDRTQVAEEHLEPFNNFERKRSVARVVKDRKGKKVLLYSHGDRTYFLKVYKTGWAGRLAAALFGSKAARELELSKELLRRGVPCVPASAAGVRAAEPWVAFPKLEGWTQLQEVLLSDQTPPARRRRLCRAYGRFARAVLDAGVWQYDFNPSNVLTDGAGFRLIDFERMKLYGGRVPEAERLRLLGRMNRVPRLSRTDRWRFLKGYADASARDRARLAELARAIASRTLKKQAEDSEDAADRCVRENRDFSPFEFDDVCGYYLKDRPERPGTGLTPDALRRLVGGDGGGLAAVEAPSAVEAWREANRNFRPGGSLPVAVVRRKGALSGTIHFRRPS
jgi:hypothetical protein